MTPQPKTILRRLQKEVRTSIELLEKVPTPDERERGQLQALRYVQSWIDNERQPWPAKAQR